jgi:predicted amidohydrolase
MVWFDREGSVLGIYRKTFPTDYEMRDDITPGPLDFDVFHTEFGPIGCAICFDLCYREVIERISSQEAKLVFFPSMFQGLDLMQAWAKLYRLYFVSCAGEPYSAVVNPIGHPVIKPWDHSSIMTLNINLDYVVIHGDYNRDKFSAVKAKYGPAIDINYIYIESAAMLSSRLPDVTAMDIVTEFDLELEKDYYTRSSKMRMDMLK